MAKYKWRLKLTDAYMYIWKQKAPEGNKENERKSGFTFLYLFNWKELRFKTSNISQLHSQEISWQIWNLQNE